MEAMADLPDLQGIPSLFSSIALGIFYLGLMTRVYLLGTGPSPPSTTPRRQGPQRQRLRLLVHCQIPRLERYLSNHNIHCKGGEGSAP